MYDNGRRANRHYCKQLHKSRQKKEYANTFYSGYSWKWIVDHTSFYYCHKNGIKYWERFYLSGRKQVAKRTSARRLRMIQKQYLSNAIDFEDDAIIYFKNGLYRRYFDADWEVW